MANASGAVKGTEAVEILYRTKRVRGVIFRPPVREGLAKLRQRAVRAICKIAKVGAVLRVVWRYETCSRFYLWTGRVEEVHVSLFRNESWSCVLRVRYEERTNTTLPFPPYPSTGVVLCAVQVSNPAKVVRKIVCHRAKPRALRGMHAQRESVNIQCSAVKKSTTVGTLNVTSLKLEGGDEFSILCCSRLCQVLSFMIEKGIDILCLQETRFKFSEDGLEDGSLYRQVGSLGHCFHIYLQSATGQDSYNGMGIISLRALAKVWKISGRVMGAEYQLEEGKGSLVNVYAPTRDSSEASHAAFLGDVVRSCQGGEAKAKQRPLLVVGDFNASITLTTNKMMDPAAISQLKGLMSFIGCKSAHSLCPYLGGS